MDSTLRIPYVSTPPLPPCLSRTSRLFFLTQSERIAHTFLTSTQSLSADLCACTRSAEEPSIERGCNAVDFEWVRHSAPDAMRSPVTHCAAFWPAVGACLAALGDGYCGQSDQGYKACDL